MKYIKRLSIALMLGLLFSVVANGFAQKAQDKGVFIVNRSVPVTSVTKKEIEKIYLGRMNAWEGKLKISSCILGPKTDLGDRFFDKVLKMSYRKYSKYWLKIVFSGSKPAPFEFQTAEDVINYVSQKDGGIGFIPESMAQSLEGCKILKVQGMDNF